MSQPLLLGYDKGMKKHEIILKTKWKLGFQGDGF
jgi:hypothetical protein